MAVPFGELAGRLSSPKHGDQINAHGEIFFTRDVSDFTAREELLFYLRKSGEDHKIFQPAVILVDDLLHKGYRMNEIDPILKSNDVEVVETVVRQTGRGRDLMTIKGENGGQRLFSA